MRILLVGNYGPDKQASMLRYTEMLRRHLSERGHEVEVIQPTAVAGRLLKRSGVRKWLGYLDKYVFFPAKLRRRAKTFDLVHVCDHSNSMYLAHTAGRPASITCHDLLAIGSAMGWYPQQRIGATGKVQQRWILRHLASAKHVVCVSTKTERELARLTGGKSQEVEVILNPLEHSCRPASEESIRRVRAKLGLRGDERYLFHVGGDAWYKNRPAVLRIFQMLRGRGLHDLKLVMAGAPLGPKLRAFAIEYLPAGSLIEVANPSDEDLWDLYGAATALLFPSLHEGFGWPLIEAQCCGCPVITSNRAPMTEVAGDAALYIDPDDEQGAATRIAERLDKLHELREPGFRNVERFDPEAVTDQYEAFFAAVMHLRRRTDAPITSSAGTASRR